MIGMIVAIVVIAVANILAYLLNENSVLRPFWEKRSWTSLCITNRSANVSVDDRPKTFFAWDLLDANHLAQCSFLTGKKGAALVLLYRVFALIYFVATILIINFIDEGLDDGFVVFFTNWSFIALAIYAIFGIGLCARHIGDDVSDDGAAREPRPYTFFDKAFAVLLCTVASCAIFLTAFYWASTPNVEYIAGNVLRHGANIGLLLGDYLISTAPMNSQWFPIVLAYTSVYAVFMWIYSTVGNGAWPYPSLNWHKDSSAVIYLFLPLGVYLGFWITYLVVSFREFLRRGSSCCTCCRPRPRACRDADMKPSSIEMTNVASPV